MYDDFIHLLQNFRAYISENDCSHKKIFKKSSLTTASFKHTPSLKVTPVPISKDAKTPLENIPKLDLARDTPIQNVELKSLSKPIEKKTTKPTSFPIESPTTSNFTQFILEPPQPKQIMLDDMRELVKPFVSTFKRKEPIYLYHQETSTISLKFLDDIAKAISSNFSRSVQVLYAKERVKEPSSLIILPIDLTKLFNLNETLEAHSLCPLSTNESLLTIYPPSSYLNNNLLKKALWETLKRIVPQLP